MNPPPLISSPPALPQQRKQAAGGMNALAIAIIALLFCVGLYWAGDQGTKDGLTGEPAAPRMEREAWYMAKQFVETRLAPKKCSFPNGWDPSAFAGQQKQADGTFKTWGYVDTVNDFNAPVRKYWAAVVMPAGGDQWECRSMAFQDKQY